MALPSFRTRFLGFALTGGLLAVSGLAAPPASAVVGGRVDRDPNGLRGSVVRIESARGELCSGALIAPDLVLTAAHCVMAPSDYVVVGVDRRFRQRPVRVVAAALHPDFVPGTTPRTQPGIDLALLRLEHPLGPDFETLDPRRAGAIDPGDAVEIAGFGITSDKAIRTARTLRDTRLVSIGTLQVANRVVVAVDPRRLGHKTGAGACRGDSGGPIVRGGPGAYQLLGIVSWSSGALHERQSYSCGGLTAITPVAEHRGWIVERAEELQRYTAPRTRNDWVR